MYDGLVIFLVLLIILLFIAMFLYGDAFDGIIMFVFALVILLTIIIIISLLLNEALDAQEIEIIAGIIRDP